MLVSLVPRPYFNVARWNRGACGRGYMLVGLMWVEFCFFSMGHRIGHGSHIFGCTILDGCRWPEAQSSPYWVDIVLPIGTVWSLKSANLRNVAKTLTHAQTSCNRIVVSWLRYNYLPVVCIKLSGWKCELCSWSPLHVHVYTRTCVYKVYESSYVGILMAVSLRYNHDMTLLVSAYWTSSQLRIWGWKLHGHLCIV